MPQRKRIRSVPNSNGVYRRYQNGVLEQTVTKVGTGSYALASETSVEDDFPNGWNSRNRLLKSKYLSDENRQRLLDQNYGTNWWLERTNRYTNTSASVSATVASIRETYEGPLWHNSFVNSLGTYPTFDTQLLSAWGWGSKAIGKAAPTAPKANTASFVGELREGLPTIPLLSLLRNPETLFGFAKDTSREYLNVQFGIVPLYRDIFELAKSVNNTRAVMEQLKRDSNRTVRRRLSDAPRISSTVTTQSVGLEGLTTPYLYTSAVNMPTQAFCINTENRWFSGKFRYAINTGKVDTLLDKLEVYEREARITMGLSPDIGTIWELTRFSWLFDWFVDVGSTLRSLNVYSHDNLVMHHGYAMSHVKTEVVSSSGHIMRGIPNPKPIVNTFVRERKMRVKASPFGFDVSLNGTTAFQNSILAALGISKVPMTLLPRW